MAQQRPLPRPPLTNAAQRLAQPLRGKRSARQVLWTRGLGFPESRGQTGPPAPRQGPGYILMVWGELSLTASHGVTSIPLLNTWTPRWAARVPMFQTGQ